jgi:hypothetical protein
VNAISPDYTIKSSSCKDAFFNINPEVLLFQPK